MLNAKYAISSLLPDRLNILLHGTAPLYFHVVNVCLHCAVTCLLMHTCESCVFEDSRLALVTALLFAVHPVHTEAVSSIQTLSNWPGTEGALAIICFFAVSLLFNS